MSKEDKVFDILMSKGFLIGSRAYGGFREGSDWDVVIDEDIYDKIKIACKNNGVNLRTDTLWGFSERMDRHNMFNVLNDKINFGFGKEVNVLAYRKVDIPKIRNVHNAMLALVGTAIGDMMADSKVFRIEIFQALKNVAFHYEISQQCRCTGFDHRSDCPEAKPKSTPTVVPPAASWDPRIDIPF